MTGQDGEEDDKFIVYFSSGVLFCLLRGGVYDQIRQQVLSCVGGRRNLSGGAVLPAALRIMGQGSASAAEEFLSACCCGSRAVRDRGRLHHQPLLGQGKGESGLYYCFGGADEGERSQRGAAVSAGCGV